MRASLLVLLLSAPAFAQAPADPYPDVPAAEPPAAEPPAASAPANAPAAAPVADSQAPAPTAAPVAPVAPHLTKLDPTSVPAQCKALAKDADATQVNRSLSARIS